MVVLARHALPRTRDIAFVVAATALSAVLGAALVRAFIGETPFGPRTDPGPAQPAPAREPAPEQLVAPPAPVEAPTAPTLAPTTSALPLAPTQDSQSAEATRQPFETLPTESVVPSFRPGGSLGPPYASIPPQN
ncbi:MAG: hypothetical protein ACRDG6_06025 [Candidatus Limnocylindria bacterium]